MDDSAITCGEAIESFGEETETVPKNVNKNMQLVKYKISIFYLHF